MRCDEAKSCGRTEHQLCAEEGGETDFPTFRSARSSDDDFSILSLQLLQCACDVLVIHLILPRTILLHILFVVVRATAPKAISQIMSLSVELSLREARTRTSTSVGDTATSLRVESTSIEKVQHQFPPLRRARWRRNDERTS